MLRLPHLLSAGLCAAILTHAASVPATLPLPLLTDYVCPGDCNRDRTVRVNEVVLGVNIVLDSADVDSCLQADANRDGSVRVNELVASVNSILAGCQPLGTRRFSLNPQTSSFTALLQLGPFTNFGFTGYLELRAGVPSTDGLAFLDLTDASDYLSIEIPGTAGGPDTVVCIKPDKTLFPIVTAGIIDCDGGTPLGFDTAQDHNVGMVGICVSGPLIGHPCTLLAECQLGHCYLAHDCEGGGGIVEAPDGAHPWVCNGPLAATQIPSDSGPGAVFIGRDPSGLFSGLPATLTTERALPCGDEGGEQMTNFAFTTALSRATITTLNNVPDATLAHEISGTNFSCRDFADENGAGTLVLAVPTLDLEVPVLGVVDFISVFTLDD